MGEMPFTMHPGSGPLPIWSVRGPDGLAWFVNEDKTVCQEVRNRLNEAFLLGRKEKTMNPFSVAYRHPPAHAKYLVRRDGQLFTATPCYGMHAPLWVVATMEGEAPPVDMRDDDEWIPLEQAAFLKME